MQPCMYMCLNSSNYNMANITLNFKTSKLLTARLPATLAFAYTYNMI